MKIICLDFETYFDDAYTLKKLTTEAYIRDPRFETLMVGIRDEHGSYSVVAGHQQIGGVLATFDWSETAVVCHHAHFDGLILSHHFGIKPAMWFDTLSMGRLMHGNHLSLALGSLAHHYELEPKSVPYDLFKGKRLEDLDVLTLATLSEGCIHDVELTWAIFQKLCEGFPLEEFGVIDMTVRMFTEPEMVGDRAMFERTRDEEWLRKAETLVELNVLPTQLKSVAKFCELIETEGVEVEYKEGKNAPIPAVAATDDFMKGLADHDNPRVAALASARLDVGSSIDETRAGRLAGIAARGGMCVYLSYAGAHTTRWSGGDKVNFQNLPRGGALRKALCASKGSLLAVVDLSQIECRILNYVAGQHDIVEAFGEGRDLYSELASRFYGREIDKKKDPTERHLGKTMELGCGYGMGASKLATTCRRGALGGPPIILEPDQAKAAIDTYRHSHAQVVNYWREGDNMLQHLAHMPKGASVQWGPMTVERGRITLPNNAPLWYDLEVRENPKTGKSGWARTTRKGWASIWGGGLVENVVQAMARVVMSQAMLRIKAMDFKIVLTTHDEIVVVVPEESGQQCYDWLVQEMKRTPEWLPGIPLDAEGVLAARYEK